MNRLFANLPTTIFEVMSSLARETGAINLGQGFPGRSRPRGRARAAAEAVLNGYNQYPSMMGIPELRTAIAAHYKHWQGVDLDATTEVMVTSGATEALAGAILGIVEPGDEVVLFEPMYDAYLPLVRLAGGMPKFVTLQPPHFRLTEEALAEGLLAQDQGGRVQQPAQPDRDSLLGRGSGSARRFLPPLRCHRDLRRGLGACGLRRPPPPAGPGARGHARPLGEDRLGGQDLQPHGLEGRPCLRRAAPS